MLKSILLTISAFIILTFTGFLFYKNLEKNDGKKIPGAPGWYKQYFEMKKNENGVIPQGALQEIYSQLTSKTSSRQVSLLTNVRELGPNNVGGRTRALLVDYNNPDHLIAGGISGGIWNSYDKGASWQPVNDFAATLSVTCITQDYFDPNIIYYGTGEGSGNSANIPGDGVYKSIDGGQTFTQLTATSGASFNYIWSVKADPSTPNVLYVATQSSGIFKSTDGGNTFTALGISGEAQDIEILGDGTVFFTKKGVGIYKSKTGDAGTFTKLADPVLPSGGVKRVEIASSNNNENVIYAAFESGEGYDALVSGIYKSADTGSTWIDVTSNFDNGSINFPWYCFTMGVHPDNPNLVFLGSQSIQYTSNGGTSWSSAEDTHSDYHALVFDPSNPNILYVGNDGGIWRFSNSNTPFGAENLNNGYNVTQFYAGTFYPFNDNDDFFAGAQDNGTQARRNNDPDTYPVFWGDGAFTHISQNDPNVSYVSYQNGEVYRADNSLEAYPNYYSVMSDPGEGTWFIHPFEVDPSDGDIVYYPTNKKLWRALDGNTFVAITNDLSGGTPYAIGVSKGVSKTVYVGGSTGLFVRIDSANMAVPGKELNLSTLVPFEVNNSFISCINVHPLKDSVCFVAMSNYSIQGRVWKITDATTSFPTWVNISGDLPSNLPVNWIEMDPENPDSVLFIGTDIGLFSTSNGGQNWIYENSIIPNVPIMQIRMRASDRRLFVYTHGRGTWTGNVAVSPSGIVSQEINYNIHVFPNPASDYITIELPEKCKVKILDVSGKTVLHKESASPKQLINIKHLPKGIYFINVTNKLGKSQVKKFIKS